MKLSRLKELRPDVWEEAKRQTIKLRSQERWDLAVIDDDLLMPLFKWIDSDQKHKPWQNIYYHDDFTLYDEWLSSQTKQPEPESKKVIEYWRYRFAGMAMQGMLSNTKVDLRIIDKLPLKFAKECINVADLLIKELQKEKP
jgi:hypothetical protein